MKKYEYLISPGCGGDGRGGVRVPADIWTALYRLALSNGAADLGRRYPPLDARNFVRAVRQGLAAEPQSPRVVRPHVPTDFQPPSAATILTEAINKPIIDGLLTLMMNGEGFTAEKVLAGNLRARPQ